MSAIFGLCAFDGHRLGPEPLAAMQAAMSAWGPDGCASWQQDNAGLGHALLITSPASRYEAMPRHAPEKKQVLVAAARLDNRDELCDFFGIPHPERTATADGRLIELAFDRWGESCPKKLFGDWSLAVWDYGRQRLFLARDQLGGTGLFYYHQPPWFAFASNLKALLALPEVPRRLSEWHLACFLTVFYEAYGAGTVWQGIEQLLPGHRGAVTATSFRREAYWRLEEVPPVPVKSDADCVEGFMAHYRRAVHCRLDAVRPVGVTLSSGLDSGSVTVLAAEAMGSQGKRLTAFTAAPLFPAASQVSKGRLADEWPLAHALAKHCGNIDHIPIRAESVSPLDGADRSLEVFPFPLHGIANAFWIMAMHDEAQRRGHGVMLTGQFGNGSVSWSGGANHIFFQFVRGDWDAGRRSLTAWKQRHGISWWAVLKRHLLRPVLGPVWHRRHRLGQPSSPPWIDYAAINPAFAQRLRVQAEMRAQHHDPSFALPMAPDRERYLTIWLNNMISGPCDHAFGAAFGQEIRDPTADLQLVEYCLGLPEEQYTCQGGDRMLLRRGLAGLMPATVLGNADKGMQGADLSFRLLQQRHEVTARLQHLQSSPLAREYLDLPLIRQSWQAIQREQTAQTLYLATGLFMRGLGAGRLLEILTEEPK